MPPLSAEQRNINHREAKVLREICKAGGMEACTCVGDLRVNSLVGCVDDLLLTRKIIAAHEALR